MTKEELLELSENTFTSNNAKQITAESHRHFNERLVDTVVTGAKQGEQKLLLDENGVIQIPEFPVYEEPLFIRCEIENSSSDMYWKIDGNSIVLNGSCECSGQSETISITNIPFEYISRVNRRFPVFAGFLINEEYSYRMVRIERNGNNLEILPGYIEPYSNGVINLMYAMIIFDEEEPEISWITSSTNAGSAYATTDLIYSNGLFIIVSYGAIFRSVNGIHWIRTEMNVSLPSQKIAYGDGKFVVIGYDTACAVSTDCENWTKSSVGMTLLSDITYGNGLFVAVSDRGGSAVSTNGTNWSTIATTPALKGLTYENGLFLAADLSGNVAISTNGTSWTTHNTGLTGAVNGITYGNGFFIALGSSGNYALSTDGMTWTTHTMESTSTFYAITYASGRFVAVGQDADYAISTDGMTWVTGSTAIDGDRGTNYDLSKIVYGNRMFLAAGQPNDIAILKV